MRGRDMPKALGFSGRLGRMPYAILTLSLAATVLALAAPSGEPFTQLLTAPWSVMGRGLDGLIRIEGNRANIADAVVSLAAFAILTWTLSVTTARRLRDLGQSPWWTVLILFSGSAVAAMVVLSCLPSKKRSSPAWSGSLNPSTVPAD